MEDALDTPVESGSDATESEVEVDSLVESTDGGSEDEGAPAEGAGIDTDDPIYRITVDGEEVEVPLSEALKGYMRQADYTRKTQALAADREQISALMTLKQALDSDPASAIDALRQIYELDAADTEVEDLDPIERELKELRQWRESQEREARTKAIVTEATAAITENGLEVTPQELLNFAVERNIGDLSTAAELMAVRATKQKSAAKVEKVEAKRTAAVVDGGRGRTPDSAKPALGKKPSIREAFAAARSQTR